MNCHNCAEEIVYPEGISGEKICKKCGLVLDENPTFKCYTHWTPEWHSNWSQQDSETLKEWLTTLRAVTCQLNIPNFPYREEAARTLRKQSNYIFRQQKLSKNKRLTIAALMHLILKEYDKMRPIKEISKELSLDSRLVMKQAWILSKTLNGEKENLKIQRKTALDYLHENAGKITNDKDLITKAENILVKMKRSGGNPIGLAAGAFYNVCKESKTKLSKEKIGEAFHISERTVVTNSARIRQFLTTVTIGASVLVLVAGFF